MNTRAVAEFFRKVQQDADLKARVDAIQAENKQQWVREVTRIAHDEGYVFGARDIDAAVEEQKKLAAELHEDELDTVSGGMTDYAVVSDGTMASDATPVRQWNFYQGWPKSWQ